MIFQEIKDYLESVLEKIGELPDRAEDFRDSTQETVEQILQRVEEEGRISEKQLTAVNNIEQGAEKWLHPRRR